MMLDSRIKIKSVKKAPPKIKITRRFLTANDIRMLTANVMKLHKFEPLQSSTIQDLLVKTREYLHKLDPDKNNHIKIKRVRLFKNAN